jgi:murein DD-endopeptidase MepM/ murein hydrolase activator NlpD
MPAVRSRPRLVPGIVARLAGCLVMVLLITLAAGSPEPAAAKDWSPYIASLRSSQLYWEGAMRAADRQVRSLARASKRTRHALARSKRVVARSQDRHEQARERLVESRQRLTIARAQLAAVSVAPASLLDLATVLNAAAIPPLVGSTDARDDTVSTMTAGSPSATALAIETSAFLSTVMAARDDVATLARELRQQERAVTRARQRLARAGRAERSRIRTIGSLRRARRAAIARREGAEAGLGAAILGMSRLAQRRIAKKTNVRPGVTSPFTFPARGRITQGFSRSHDGIDIAGYRGTPIRAAAIGVISFIGWNPWDQHGRAFMVVVAHPGGFETLYGHILPSRAVRVGEVVKKGQVIGYMGNTGRSTGVHLHLEFRRGRTILNPLAFL